MGAQWYGNLDLTYSCSSDPLPGTGNISADPLFVDPLLQDFHLQSNSPCIDTGDPASPFDPDSTRADMGALYFDQNTQPTLQIALTPFGCPIVIPSQGGRFGYDVQVSNNAAIPETADVWISATLPGGSQTGPLVGPVRLTLPAQITVARTRIQDVPGNAPVGIYCYRACIGTYPEIIADSDSFYFEKNGSSAVSSFGEWSNRGEEFSAGDGFFYIYAEVFSLDVSPAPFNLSCAVMFHLPAADRVRLTVYDLAGRKEMAVFSGLMNSGDQRLVLDGGKLNSGVHFYSLQVGDRTVCGKLVLLK